MAELYCPCCTKQIAGQAQFCPDCRIPPISTKPQVNACFCKDGESVGKYFAKRISLDPRDEEAVLESIRILTGLEEEKDIKKYLDKVIFFNH